MKKRLRLKLLLVNLLFLVNITRTNAQCSFTGLGANYCTNSATAALTTTSTGGSFAGPGVIGSIFNPSIAGPGTHTITYSICSPTYAITGGTGTVWFNPTPMPTVTTGPETPTIVTLTDDQITPNALPIGFSFKFFCNTYTTFYISSNGFITFGTSFSSGCCSGQLLPDATTPNDVISLAWEDWNPPAGGTISFATVGTAPNRKLLVTYAGIPHFGSGGGALTSQLQLYESTNVIEIHTTSMITDGGNHTMGIENSLGTAGYAVAGRNSTTTWSAANEMYRFTPGTSCIASQTTVVSPSTISVVGNSSICAGSTASLTALGNTTYTWSTASNSNSVTVAPAANQTYSVSGTNSFGCIANSAITVTVDNTPTVTAISSTGGGGVCPGKTLTLNGTGATSYTWTGGITNGVAFSIPSTTNYTVTGGNACGNAAAAISISIHPLPLVTPATTSSSLCSGSSVTLTAAGNATAYAWSGGPLPITSGVGFSPITTLTYTVIGTSALSCTAAASIPVTVVTTPIVAPVATPPLICLGKSSTLTATGASNYTWTSASQTVFTSSFIVSPGIGATTYTISKANANCFNTQVVTVTTNSLPTIFAIVTPTLVCALKPATLAVGGGQSYTWTSPGPPTFTFSGSSPVIYPPVSTTYSVAATDGTCVNTTTVFLAANPNPTISAVASSSAVCNGQTVSLNASGGTNYTWTASSGTFTGQSIADSPTTSINYVVMADNSFGCSSLGSAIVIVNPNPTITIVPSRTLVCNGGSVTLNATGANTYSWDPNANNALTASTLVNPTSLTSGSVIYTVEGTYSATGCKSTKTVLLAVFIPTLTVSGNTNTCLGGNVTLNASGGNPNTYSWYTIVGGAPSAFATLNTTVAAAAIFTVNAITSSLTVNCPATKTVAVDVFFNPTITAVPQRATICTKEFVNIFANGGVTYNWSNSMSGGTINVNPLSNTIYTVTGIDANGCVGTGTVQVKVSGCAGINELGSSNGGLVVYPNPSNGEFNVAFNSTIMLTLVNELGQLVRVIELSQANDYKVSVSELAKGIYFITGQKENVHVNQKIIITK